VSGAARKRPPLSPREAWISDGRQVLHFRPRRYGRWSQNLEVTFGEVVNAMDCKECFCRSNLRVRSSSPVCRTGMGPERTKSVNNRSEARDDLPNVIIGNCRWVNQKAFRNCTPQRFDCLAGRQFKYVIRYEQFVGGFDH
jgi:hypothetical protein